MSYRFGGTAEAMGVVDFVNLPNRFLADELRLSDESLLQAVRGMDRDSLLLVQKEFAELSGSGLEATFNEDEELALGREASINEVRFGQMVLSSAFDYERPELIAAKPFRRPKDALHELAISAYLNKTTKRQHAFQPIGLWRNDRGLFHLLSRYEHSVITYDSVLWADKEVEPEALAPGAIAKALRVSMLGLGQLHALGFSHGDAQVKNLGADSEKVRFIDLQNTRVFPRSHSTGTPDVIATKDRAQGDIETLLRSCFEVLDNIPQIAPVMEEQADCMAKSYLRGVTRQRTTGSHRYPEQSIPTHEDLVERINNMVTLAE